LLVVPALVVLGRAPMQQAVGTSLLVIAMNAVSGFAGYIGHVSVPWGFITVFTAVAVGGIVLGTYGTRFVPQRQLKQAFALFLVVMGSFMLYRNRAVFLASTAGTQATHAAGHRAAPADSWFTLSRISFHAS
jgi:uncharacterized membrane protein YfcA